MRTADSTTWLVAGVVAMGLLAGFGGAPAWAVDAGKETAIDEPPPDDPPMDLPEDAEKEFGRGRRGGKGHERFGPRMWHRMSEAERAEFRTFLLETFPERFEDLDFGDLESEDNEVFRRLLGRMLPEMMKLKDMKERDPVGFQIRVQEMRKEFAVRRLARRYRFATDDDSRKKIEEELRPLVGELFDLRTQREAYDLQRLEQRLADLRERQETRVAHREDHIDRVLEDILSGKMHHKRERGQRFLVPNEGADEGRPAEESDGRHRKGRRRGPDPQKD